MSIPLFTTFTNREVEIIQLLLQGKSTGQIASQFGVCARAVEHHLTHIYEKLGVSSRTEAVIKVIYLYEKEQDSGIRS